VQVSNGATNTTSTILIDYNYLPIRCRACGDTKHCLKDCSLRARQDRSRNRATNSQRRGQTDARSGSEHGKGGEGQQKTNGLADNSKGKQPEVDEEGFQRPKYKGWRRSGSGARNNDSASGRKGSSTAFVDDAGKQQVNSTPVQNPRAQSPIPNEQENGSMLNQKTSDPGVCAQVEEVGVNTPVRAPVVTSVVELIVLAEQELADNIRTSQSPRGEQLERDRQMIPYNNGSIEHSRRMVWSPERRTGRKRAGSPQGVGSHSSASARRLNPIQDLNVSPMEGEGLGTNIRLALPNCDNGGSVQPERESFQSQELNSGVHYSMHTSTEERAHRGILRSHSTPTSNMDISLSPGEVSLLDQLGNSHQQLLPVRDVREVEQGLEVTTLSAPRIGQIGQRLRGERSIAELYGNGVQMTRREIDFRVPMDSSGARRLMVISESPERALSSDQSLPWPE
jgi:hypothetical protein